MTNPFSKNDSCSRCGKIGETIWHVCKECADKAQEKYKNEVLSAIFADDPYNMLDISEVK